MESSSLIEWQANKTDKSITLLCQLGIQIGESFADNLWTGLLFGVNPRIFLAVLSYLLMAWNLPIVCLIPTAYQSLDQLICN